MRLKISFGSFLIPLLILLFSFMLVVFDVEFYKDELEKHNVYDVIDKDIADLAVENLISYMKSEVQLSNFFNDKEKMHMEDVKNIVDKTFIFFYLLLAVTVGFLFFHRKKFFDILFYGGIISLILILLFFICSFMNFDSIFYKFHELVFSNDLWKLNPEVDYLKALMPDAFFYDALVRIFSIAFVTSGLLALVGFFGLRRKNK